MAQLAAWTFGEEDGAYRVEPTLARLATQGRFVLRDARVLSWPVDSVRPAVRRVYSVPLTGAIDDIVWGLFLGQVLYGEDGSRAAPLTAIGISSSIVERLRQTLRPGRSGLVVVGDDEQMLQLAKALAPKVADVSLDLRRDLNAAVESLTARRDD